MLLTLTIINSSAATVTPKASGIGDSADYLLDVPDENNYIYYSSDWKAHGLSWTSFKIFCKSQYDPSVFNYSDRGGYIYTKTIDGENFYEAEFNNDVSAYGIIEGCNIIAIQPVQIQFDKAAFDSGENVPLGNYIDTSAYTYIATRLKVESENTKPKSVSVMLRPKNRDQYIDNMAGTFLIDNKTRKIQGPYPSFKYVELTSDFDGWIVMPVADMAEGKPLSELVTVSFFCHSEGHSDKCGHRIENTDWTDSTLYIGDMMLVKDVQTFNKVRTSCSVLGHSYGEPVVVNPTATAKGTSTITCTVCGHKDISYLVNSLSGKSVEGINATVQITGNSNIGENVILKAQNVTSTITSKNKNVIIRGVNSLKDKIKSRKLASIFDLELITRETGEDGKSVETTFSSTGTLNITLPIDSAIINNYKNLNVVLVLDDGTAKLLNSSISNGKLTFSTDTLGSFALVGGTKTASDKETSSENKNQEASSNTSSITSSSASKEETASSKDNTNKDNSSVKSSNISDASSEETVSNRTDSSTNSDISNTESAESTTTIISDSSDSTNNQNKSNTPFVLIIVIGAVAVCGLITASVILLRKAK